MGKNISPSFLRRRGFTLMELVIVLFVVAAIIAGLWSVASSVFSGQNTQRLHQQIMTVVENIREYHMSTNKISISPPSDCADKTSLNAYLDDETRRLIPMEMRASEKVAGGTLVHALGGTFIVECANDENGSNPGSRFRLRMLGLTPEKCVRALMSFPVLTPEVGAAAVGAQSHTIFVNSFNVPTPDSGGYLPFKPADLMSWCDAKGSNNEVRLVFKLRN